VRPERRDVGSEEIVRSILEVPTPIERATARAPMGRPAMLAFVADGETERVLRECLEHLGYSDTPVARGGILKAIDTLGTHRSPELLIVDLGGVALPVSEIHNLAEVCEPGVTVIAIGDRNEVGLYRDLLQAGVTDYIVKPLTAPLLQKALNARSHAGEPAAIHHKLGTTVAFVGARGGVGTTTLAVNLAWHLAERQHRRVALVDLDLHNGECAMALNIKATPGLREALSNPSRIDSILLERVMAPVGHRLFVLSAEEPLRDNIEFTPEAVDTLVKALRQQFHYVVLDVPRVSAHPYFKALDPADFRIVVADQTLRSARDAVRLREALGDGGDGKHRNLLVINREGEGGRYAITLEEMQNILQLRPKTVVPFQPAWFAPAADNSMPVAAARRGKFGAAIADLAQELSGRPLQKRRWWGGGS
jgi:pilus assembly protein CpaE